VFQSLPRSLPKADHPLLDSLGVLDEHSLGCEVHVRQLEIGELAGPEARARSTSVRAWFRAPFRVPASQ